MQLTTAVEHIAGNYLGQGFSPLAGALATSMASESTAKNGQNIEISEYN
ncbi:hypothetical protein [Paenibacillus phytorum]|nr:hypothetical protein [Paenibacillus phytorum]